MNRQQQQLVEDNMNLVYHIINRHFPTYAKDEDITQIGMLGLCHAAETWDETKGLFSTYGGRCIRNQIGMEFKYRNRQRRSGHTLSLEHPVAEDMTLGDVLVGDTDVSFVDLQAFYDDLTPTEQELFDSIYNGVPKGDIAKNLGVSRQTVSTYTRLLKKRLEDFCGN